MPLTTGKFAGYNKTVLAAICLASAVLSGIWFVEFRKYREDEKRKQQLGEKNEEIKQKILKRENK